MPTESIINERRMQPGSGEGVKMVRNMGVRGELCQNDDMSSAASEVGGFSQPGVRY